MKIAIPFNQDGTLFEHTGSTENFKIYEVDDNKSIISSAIISTNGEQHALIAAFLRDHDVNVLLCGDIGSRLYSLLKIADVRCYSTLSGDCDKLVQAYLDGALKLNDAPTHECSCGH